MRSKSNAPNAATGMAERDAEKRERFSAGIPLETIGIEPIG
jgi:hypothetical protein